MRIPSDLNTTLLYPNRDVDSGQTKPREAMKRQSSNQAVTLRRLFRLVLALAVVLIVMQKAGNPKYYRVFFAEGSSEYRIAEADSTPAAVNPEVALVGEAAADSRDPIDDRSLQTVLDDVVDGSVWLGADAAAFDRMRAEADTVGSGGDGDVANIGVLPLLQQSDLYRGEVFRFAGTVARIDPVKDFYQLWIKPSDGTNRPLIAIVNHVPESFQPLTRSISDDPPEVTIIGRFIKRLAYRSGKGADVAPVLIGRIETVGAGYLVESEAERDAAPVKPMSSSAWIWLVTSAVLGLGFGVLVFIRSNQLSRRMRAERQKSQSHPIHLPSLFLALAAITAVSSAARADSGLSLLAGFDAERLENVFPMDDRQAVGEMARLLYQIGRIDRSTWQSLATDPFSRSALGDVIRFEGRLDSIQVEAVPDDLAEYLEFDRFARLTVQPQSSDVGPLIVFTKRWPKQTQAGDVVSGVGVSLAEDQDAEDQDADRRSLFSGVLASAEIGWRPASSSSVGWDLLSKAGFDLGLLDEVAEANRNPLRGEDRRSFYSLLFASSQVDAPELPPKRVPVTDLLSAPQSLAGDWLRLDLELLRVTKVSVLPPELPSGLPASLDHYYQLDAVGDLGNVEVQIQANQPGGPPLIFENRFPVSVVTTNLPPSLSELLLETGETESISLATRQRIQVDGFFYRLWSYESDLSGRDPASSDQLGPLVMATSIVARPSDTIDAIGVRRIGWTICGMILVGFFAILLWNWSNSRQDRRLKRRRLSSE